LKSARLSVTLVPAAAEGRVFAGLLRGAVVMGDKLAPDIFQMNQVAHLTARRGRMRASTRCGRLPAGVRNNGAETDG
jgi:hypothetical protein